MSAADTAPLDALFAWGAAILFVAAIGSFLASPWFARHAARINRRAIERQRRQWAKAGNVERRQVKR